MKPVQVNLRRRGAKRENNGGDEPNLDTIYVYMEMSPKPLYNSCTNKTFF
jgi:hypothetical protein